MLREGEPAQFPGEFEGREDRVLGREGDERRGGQRPVRVDPGSAVAEAVLLLRGDALGTAAPGVINAN